MASAAVRPSRRHFSWDTRLQQREKFTTCIKNNVREYGGGSTCLKELLANADDARATRFTVCLDKSQYSTDSLLSVGMEELQGPALWVCNDAKFSHQDYRHYTLSVGESAKAEDSETIGKFGKGALTVYSLTDVIQILSADSLLVWTLMVLTCQTNFPQCLAIWSTEETNTLLMLLLTTQTSLTPSCPSPNTAHLYLP